MKTSSKKSFFLPAYCLVITLLSVLPGAAQQEVTEKVDAFIRSEMQKESIPGLALAVVKNGNVALAKGYGYANIEHKVLVKPETVFQSGSVGKQFTATAVMMLVEESKINLDDKIGKYLGQVPDTWEKITVRHLLTHTSGLTDYPKDFDFRRDYSEDELLKQVEDQPLAFAPGEKWQYSNLGYVTLGILIHKVSGKFYGDYLQERIFKPLGMSATRIITEADIVPNRAAGYRLVNGEIKNQRWVSPSLNTTADGSLYLTVLDMAKWDAALYTEKLLRKTSLEKMWSPVKLNDNKTSNYGFGWFLSEINKHRIIEHEGAWQGFTSDIARYVDDGLTVIVLDNLAGAKAEKIAHEVAGIYNPLLAPPHYKAIADKEPQITILAKDLMHKFAEGKADPNLFTPELRAAFFPERARQFENYLKPIGEPQKVQLVERTEQTDRLVYRYEFFYKNVTLLFTMNLNKNGKIAELQVVDNY